jgi:hypothetical protein
MKFVFHALRGAMEKAPRYPTPSGASNIKAALVHLEKE